jgi:monothiol glutaredoxin
MAGLKLNPFRISRSSEQPAGVEASGPDGARSGAESDRPAADRIDSMVRSHAVFALIKGTPQQPRCGFSANTVAVLDALGVPYATFDVLSDESIRAAAKEYARWPTFPQVFVGGELVGGHDIVTEMHQSGELQALVETLQGSA